MLNLSLSFLFQRDIHIGLGSSAKASWEGECLVLYGISPQRHPFFIGSSVVDPCADTFPLKGLISFLGL